MKINIYKYELLTFFTIPLLLAATSTKQLLLTYIGYGIFLFFFTRDTLKSVLFKILLLSLSFDVIIRGWTIQTVISHAINHYHYEFFFGFSVSFLTTISLLLLLIKNRMQIRALHIPTYVYFLGFTVLWSLISALVAQNTSLALFGVVQLFTSASILILSIYFFSDANERTYFIHQTIIVVLYAGLLGTIQYIYQHPIGLFIEQTKFLAPSGYMTTDGVSLQRVAGQLSHPTYFGTYLSLLLPIVIGSFVLIINTYKRNRIRWILYLSSSVLGSIALLATFSRSAWISMILIVFLYILNRHIALRERKRMSLSSIFLIAGSVICVVFFGMSEILTRLSSFSTLMQYGNAAPRIELMKIAWNITKQNPIIGIGLNHFTTVVDTMNVPNIIARFIYPVHNTFLLFLSEIGFPAGLAFILFCIIGIIKTYNITQSHPFSLFAWLGCVTFFINSQVHTIFNQDPSFSIFMVLLGYLIATQYNAKTYNRRHRHQKPPKTTRAMS